MKDIDKSVYVKKETMLLVALIAVVAGFLGGIVFSVYYSGSDQSVSSSAPGRSASQGKSITEQQANRILVLEKEVAANPENVDAWTQLGHVYFDTDNYPKAIKAYEKSLQLRPDDANILTDLGVMYRRNGQPDKALEAFDKAIKIDPTHEQSRFNKGVVLRYDFNDREGAIKAWEELLKINPAATLADGRPLRDAINDL